MLWEVYRNSKWLLNSSKSRCHCCLQTLFFSSVDTKPFALKPKKAKAKEPVSQHFIDNYRVEAIGGKGGDGCISFLQLWSNANAGPDGGDGGNGGHVIFKVPIGTVIRNRQGVIVGDLSVEGAMFIAARGGAGGRGNRFFVSDTLQAPQIAEFGAEGENCKYTLEVKSMAHIGLIGMPNAGKSTLLRAISRARPKVAAYAFTTLKPHLGMVQYSDHEQIAVADLPGLVEGSHQNKGLGIAFLKHAERCSGLLFVIDLSHEDPYWQYSMLRHEIKQFSEELSKRPFAVVGNKIDLKEAQDNFKEFESRMNHSVFAISSKTGENLPRLLRQIRVIYDEYVNAEPKI